MSRLHAWCVGVGVGPSSAGHQLWSQMEVFFMKISASAVVSHLVGYVGHGVGKVSFGVGGVLGERED